jgi:hypothetical protein
VTVGVGAVLTAMLSSCSADGETEPSAEAPSTPAVCASADAFRASLAALGDLQVVQDGTDALDEAWTTVRDDWETLADDARAEFADQIDGVQGDVDAAQSAVDTVRDDPSAATLRTAADAVRVFLQDAGALVDEVRATC